MFLYKVFYLIALSIPYDDLYITDFACVCDWFLLIQLLINRDRVSNNNMCLVVGGEER